MSTENRGSPAGEIEWRSLFPRRQVEAPTYVHDVVGPVERFDERDCVFARMDLNPGSERYEAYYQKHEELRATDDYLRSMPPLGSTGGPSDSPVLASLFGSSLIAGRPLDAASAGGGTVGTAPAAAPVWMGRDEAAAKVKSLARFLGADLVAVGPLNPAHIYSHVGRTFYGQKWGEEISLDHPNAISLGFAMDYDFLRSYTPAFPVILESGLAYARAAYVAVQLAIYIRGLGYSARAHHLRDYQVLSVPVAIDAGMGELGRSGVLLTREYGSGLRLATVTTDLPMELDPPVDLGIQEYCRTCKLCALACPSGAIPRGDKIAHRGVKRWKLAAGRCHHYWRQVGSDCALCLVECPWSRPDNLTQHLRPSHQQPVLDAETLARARQIRSTLPTWLQKSLGVEPATSST